MAQNTILTILKTLLTIVEIVTSLTVLTIPILYLQYVTINLTYTYIATLHGVHYNIQKQF